jgi:hypothetical protein
LVVVLAGTQQTPCTVPSCPEGQLVQVPPMDKFGGQQPGNPVCPGGQLLQTPLMFEDGI